jgi:hypothetical protein
MANLGLSTITPLPSSSSSSTITLNPLAKFSVKYTPSDVLSKFPGYGNGLSVKNKLKNKGKDVTAEDLAELHNEMVWCLFLYDGNDFLSLLQKAFGDWLKSTEYATSPSAHLYPAFIKSGGGNLTGSSIFSSDQKTKLISQYNEFEENERKGE